MFGINLACLEDVDTFKLKNVSINDGKNHPLDKKMIHKYFNSNKVTKSYLSFLKRQEVLESLFITK